MAAEKLRRVPAQPDAERRFSERSDLRQITDGRASRDNHGMALRIAQVQDGEESQLQSQSFEQENLVRNKCFGHSWIALQDITNGALGQMVGSQIYSHGR